MGFLRRLFGSQSGSAETSKPNIPPMKTGAPAPEIAAPGAAVAATVPSPVVQAPPQSTEASKLATQDLTAAPTLPMSAPMFGATRQLPPLDSPMKPGKRVLYGLSTDVGMVRSNNQDSSFTMYSSTTSVEIRPDFGMFIVADGMGGHHDGELASALAVRTIVRYVVDNFYRPLLNELSDGEKPVISEILTEAVQKANDAVSTQLPEGGTTVTAAAMFGDLLYIAHVGDSRAYLITSEGIEQITRDHSLVQRLIELDQLTPEEAASHPQRNVLYRAIGQSENLEVDAITHRLPAGARLLICSDGLWNQVSESNLLQIVQTSRSPQEACDHLITIANDRGGPDNITVILVQAPG